MQKEKCRGPSTPPCDSRASHSAALRMTTIKYGEEPGSCPLEVAASAMPTQAKSGLEWARRLDSLDAKNRREEVSQEELPGAATSRKQVLRCAQDFGRRLKRRQNASTSTRAPALRSVALTQDEKNYKNGSGAAAAGQGTRRQECRRKGRNRATTRGHRDCE